MAQAIGFFFVLRASGTGQDGRNVEDTRRASGLEERHARYVAYSWVAGVVIDVDRFEPGLIPDLSEGFVSSRVRLAAQSKELDGGVDCIFESVVDQKQLGSICFGSTELGRQLTLLGTCDVVGDQLQHRLLSPLGSLLLDGCDTAVELSCFSLARCLVGFQIIQQSVFDGLQHILLQLLVTPMPDNSVIDQFVGQIRQVARVGPPLCVRVE